MAELVRDADLRLDLWQLIRVWLRDMSFTDSNGYPFEAAASYSFTPCVTHALSLWKLWLQERKCKDPSSRLLACYKRSVKNEKRRQHVTIRLAPDRSEKARQDYRLLADTGASQPCLTAVESEWGNVEKEWAKDFPKLLTVSCPLKAMIFGLPEQWKEPLDESFHRAINYFRRRMLEERVYSDLEAQPRERWLFVGVPWPKDWEWPPNREHRDAQQRIRLLTTPCDLRTGFVEPRWDLWRRNLPMERWIRSLYEGEAARPSSEAPALQGVRAPVGTS